MCSVTLSMSMYSYGCVGAVGVAVCVSCCILYDTTRAIPIIHITDNNTNRISTIVIERITIIRREETDESDTGVGNVSK